MPTFQSSSGRRRDVSRRLIGVALALTLTGGVVALAVAQTGPDDEACPLPETELDKYRYLRALSLDLRGELPSETEIAALESAEDVDEALVDQLLDSPLFAERVVRSHRALVWNNVDNQTLFNARVRLRTQSSTGLYYRSGSSATLYRGLSVPCEDVPAVEDGNGGYVQTAQGDGSMREGYVMVTPYWDPSTQIKVCAYDALEYTHAPDGTPCDTNDGIRIRGCGCGPNLNWCSTTAHENLVQEAFGRDIDMRVRNVINEGRSYLDLFSEDVNFVNGPVAHYWRYQTGVPTGLVNEPHPIDAGAIPTMAYDQTELIEVPAPTEHAGVLTAPGFLLRFQTNRGRATRAFDAFLCQPFQAPDGPLPVADVRAQQEPDLQVRDGCKYCHAILEPAAAYWGRWTERGAGFLDPALYPAQDEECQACANEGLSCSSVCSRNYLTRSPSPEYNPYLGWLRAYEFRAPEHYANVEMGPELLIRQTLADGRLTHCAASRAAESLLGRALAEDEEPWIADVAADFAHSDYTYRELVKAIVTSPTYRRVR